MFGCGLVMASLNINSLLAHIDELRLFMETSTIDILAINETKIDPLIKNNEISITGFDVVRRDRPTNGRFGGGVCLYVRANINYQIRNDLNDDLLEMITIEITRPQTKSFLVSTWYRPPSSTSDLYNAFESTIDKIDITNLDYYLLGDINCDFSDPAKASVLSSIFDVYGLTQLIDEPTRITHNTKTIIDLCVTNAPDKVSKSGVHHLGISDHSMVFMTRKAKYERQGKLFIKMRNFKNFNRTKFLHDLTQMPWSKVQMSDDPNNMWEQWKEMFIGCVDHHAPIISKRVRGRKSPWLTKELKQKMHQRDYLKKKAISLNDNLLWEQYRKAKNQTTNAIKLAKKTYCTERLENNEKNPRETWKIINTLLSRNVNNSSIVQELKIDGQTVTSSSEIADKFNDFFTNIGETLAHSLEQTGIKPESYVSVTSKSFNIQPPSIETVSKLLASIDERKAVGLDNLPNRLLKISSDIIAPSLTSIFHRSITTGIFPTEWKIAKVTPVFKKGEKYDPGNYRPISVISTISKIYEKIIYDQLYNYFNENNLLTNCQSGFRTLHSTVTALVETTNHWSVNIDKGMFNGVIFIDLKKAFDTIDHTILLQKLKLYGLDDQSLKWFSSYLSDRTQYCNVNGSLSKPCKVSYGIPQGSNLGPLLFLIYINDLPNCVSQARPRMFADDTNITLSADNLSELERLVNNELRSVHNWLIANKLTLNITKTEFMIIGSRQKLTAHGNEPINIQINNEAIKRVNHSKSLGVTIDSHLTWAEHVREISKKIASAIGALKRVRPYISKRCALQIYKALILPHFDYCSSVWDGLNVTLSDKLQKLQNRAARAISQVGYDIRSCDILRELNWDTLAKRRKIQKSLLMFKILNRRAPSYLVDLVSSYKTNYRLRDIDNKLSLPKPNTEYLKRSFSYSAAKVWNELPASIRSISSYQTFKKEIHSHQFSTAS